MGRINIRGLTSFGTDTADVDFPFGQYQTSSAFQFSSGNHDLRWGFDWKHYRSDGAYNFFFDGLLIYENQEDFLTNAPRRFIGAEAGADSNRRISSGPLCAIHPRSIPLESIPDPQLRSALRVVYGAHGKAGPDLQSSEAYRCCPHRWRSSL